MQIGPGAVAACVGLCSVEEHLAFMAAAGLDAFCVWHFLSQAIILGMKPAQ